MENSGQHNLSIAVRHILQQFMDSTNSSGHNNTDMTLPHDGYIQRLSWHFECDKCQYRAFYTHDMEHHKSLCYDDFTLSPKIHMSAESPASVEAGSVELNAFVDSDEDMEDCLDMGLVSPVCHSKDTQVLAVDDTRTKSQSDSTAVLDSDIQIKLEEIYGLEAHLASLNIPEEPKDEVSAVIYTPAVTPQGQSTSTSQHSSQLPHQPDVQIQHKSTQNIQYTEGQVVKRRRGRPRKEERRPRKEERRPRKEERRPRKEERRPRKEERQPRKPVAPRGTSITDRPKRKCYSEYKLYQPHFLYEKPVKASVQKDNRQRRKSSSTGSRPSPVMSDNQLSHVSTDNLIKCKVNPGSTNHISSDTTPAPPVPTSTTSSHILSVSLLTENETASDEHSAINKQSYIPPVSQSVTQTSAFSTLQPTNSVTPPVSHKRVSVHKEAKHSTNVKRIALLPMPVVNQFYKSSTIRSKPTKNTSSPNKLSANNQLPTKHVTNRKVSDEKSRHISSSPDSSQPFSVPPSCHPRVGEKRQPAMMEVGRSEPGSGADAVVVLDRLMLA